MTDLELSGYVAGITAAIRQQWPVDGRWVLVLALGVSAAVCALETTAPADWRALAAQIVRVWGGAVGGTSLLGYAAGKVGEAQARAADGPETPRTS